MLQDEPLYSRFKKADVEIYQQTSLNSSQFHVCEELGTMNREEFFNGLDLNNQVILDSNIDSESTIQLPVFIHYWYRLLSLELCSFQAQFIAEALFVGRFEKSGS